MSTDAPAPARPPLWPGLLVIAAIQILWGLYSLFAGTISAIHAGISVTPDPGPLVDPTARAYALYPMVRWTTLVHSVLASIWGVGFVAGAVGLCLRARWGRTLTVVCAWMSLSVLVLDTILSSASLFPDLPAHLQTSDPSLQQTAAYALMIVGCSCLIGPLYPLAILLVLRIPFVKEQLEPAPR